MIDRIDFVFAHPSSGNLSILDSQIVGPACEPDVALAIDPWPSDHLAVVSTMQLTPAEPPPFVSVTPKRVNVGSSYEVRYHAPFVEGESFDYEAVAPWEVAVVTADAESKPQRVAALPPYEARYFGSVTFGTGGYAPGKYAVVLTNGDKVAVQCEFWVVATGAVPRIEAAQASFAKGKPVTFSWHAAPGNRADWIGLYPAHGLNLYSDYVGFVYTNATIAGQHAFEEFELGAKMLGAGGYMVHLMVDDSYQSIAQAAFVVR